MPTDGSAPATASDLRRRAVETDRMVHELQRRNLRLRRPSPVGPIGTLVVGTATACMFVLVGSIYGLDANAGPMLLICILTVIAVAVLRLAMSTGQSRSAALVAALGGVSLLLMAVLPPEADAAVVRTEVIGGCLVLIGAGLCLGSSAPPGR